MSVVVTPRNLRIFQSGLERRRVERGNSSFGTRWPQWIPASAGMTILVRVTYLTRMTSFPRKRGSIA